MYLSDRDIRAALAEGGLVISPLGDNAIQPASVDVRLGRGFQRIKTGAYFKGDSDNSQQYQFVDGARYVLEPGEFILATTLENITVPSNLCIKIEGKSSRGRIGLQVENAGFVDPGFDGQLTLELVNLGPGWIEVVEGMYIAQLKIATLSSPAERPYNGRYQGQRGPTGAR